MTTVEWIAGGAIWGAIAVAAWYVDMPGELLVVAGAAGLCIADLVEGWVEKGAESSKLKAQSKK